MSNGTGRRDGLGIDPSNQTIQAAPIGSKTHALALDSADNKYITLTAGISLVRIETDGDVLMRNVLSGDTDAVTMANAEHFNGNRYFSVRVFAGAYRLAFKRVGTDTVNVRVVECIS